MQIAGPALSTTSVAVVCAVIIENATWHYSHRKNIKYSAANFICPKIFPPKGNDNECMEKAEKAEG